MMKHSRSLCLGLCLIVWLILASCASSVTDAPTATDLINGKPVWLNAPQEYCGRPYWCAVGEGPGMMAAQTNARKNIALMLEVEVKSKFQTTATHQQHTTANGIAGISTQDTTSVIQEATDQTLQGVTIKEQFADAENCYALAMLDRAQAAQTIRAKVEAIDTQIASLYETGKRSSFYQLLKLIPPRQALAEKAHTLTGQSLSLPISFQEIQKQQRIYEAQRPAVKIAIINEDLKGRTKTNLTHLLHQVLSENGYQVRAKNAVYQLKVDFDERPEHLKVEGFAKYSYHLTLKSERLSDHTALGSLEVGTTATGRNQKDIWANVEKELYQKINQAFLALNLD